MGDVARMELVGGHTAVDYVNTLGGKPDDPDDEYLSSYRDLLTWLGRAGVMDAAQIRRLQHAAESDPPGAAAAHQQALHLRKALDEILRSRLASHPSARHDREIVREFYADAVANATLAEDNTGYRLTWVNDGPPALRSPLWRLADRATNLLRDEPLQRLNRCGQCRWLFLDLSRNRSRRWCSMNACGAITKMRRYRAAHRSD